MERYKFFARIEYPKAQTYWCVVLYEATDNSWVGTPGKKYIHFSRKNAMSKSEAFEECKKYLEKYGNKVISHKIFNEDDGHQAKIYARDLAKKNDTMSPVGLGFRD